MNGLKHPKLCNNSDMQECPISLREVKSRIADVVVGPTMARLAEEDDEALILEQRCRHGKLMARLSNCPMRLSTAKVNSGVYVRVSWQKWSAQKGKQSR